MKTPLKNFTAFREKLREIKHTGENSFSSADYFNTSNSLTLFRVLLIGPTVVLIEQKQYFMALCTIVVAYGLDFFDGYVARKLNQVTDFGAKFDPTADKGLNLFILNFCSIAIIFQNNFLGINLIFLITFIEIILIIIAWIIKPIMEAYGFTRKLGANWMGKTKMVFESAAIISAILFYSQWLVQIENIFIFLANLFLVLAIILGIGSILGHLVIKNKKV